MLIACVLAYDCLRFRDCDSVGFDLDRCACYFVMYDFCQFLVPLTCVFAGSFYSDMFGLRVC